MKIIQVIPSLNSGGAEKFCVTLCNELSKTNEVILCTMFDISDSMVFFKQLSSSVRVVTLNKKLGLDFRIFYKLYIFIRREKPNVVHSHLGSLLYLLVAIFFKNLKIFHTIHTLAQKETSRSKLFLYKILFKYFNVVPVSISDMVLSSVKNFYGDNFNYLVENGILEPTISKNIHLVKQEIDSYKNSKNTHVIASIGRIVESKNHMMLLRAVENIIKEDHDLLLLIIGDAQEKDKLLLNKLKQFESDKIKFLGFKENVLDYLSCCDAFCMSSIYEGLPITLLEALSLGVIPICTPAGGIVDVVDQEIGFIAGGFEVENYQESLRSYLNLKDEQKTIMQQKCRQKYIEKYSIEKCANEYQNLYNLY